jgi:hypothetical protein
MVEGKTALGEYPEEIHHFYPLPPYNDHPALNDNMTTV